MAEDMTWFHYEMRIILQDFTDKMDALREEYIAEMERIRRGYFQST